MKRNKILLILIFCLISCAFLVIGYASVTRDLFISGNANIQPPEKKIYISNVREISTSNVNSVTNEYFYPTNFSSSVNARGRNGTITYEIEIHNNTDITYWYQGIELVSDFESNNLIGEANGISITTKDKLNDNSLTFNKEDWVPPHTYRTFYVVYSFGSNALGYQTTFVNFRFDIAMDGVYDNFAAILNDKSSGGGYEYISKIFNEKYATDKTTVIGNIGKDKEIFDKLFGSDLKLEIDGVEKPVTIMIRRENVDSKETGDSYTNGPKGCEYTLYITVDNLSPAGSSATVYAISYTVDPNGEVWYQLAELYEGTAKSEDYDTSNNTYEGSIDIDSWIATKKDYEVADGLIYKVGYEQGDQYDKIKKLEDLMSTFDQDIFNDIDNTKIMKKVYDILQENRFSDTEEVNLLRNAYLKATPYFTNYNSGQEFKVNRTYTRAQIVPIIAELQEALDYYHQIRG